MRRSSICLSVISALLILLSASWVEGGQALGQAEEPQQGTCDELQTIFLVDQSLSMSHRVPDGGNSDPTGLRFYGPKYAVRTLSSLRYQSYSGVTMRVAQVYFGDTPGLRLNWTDLSATNQTEHEALLDTLAPSFEPVNDMGNTNVLKPFQNASSLFNQVRPQTNDCPVRVLIVITDGRPSLTQTGFDWRQHMDELVQYVSQYMPPPDHHIYVIGIDQQDAYWPDVEPYWDRVTGNPASTMKAQTANEMASMVADIVSKEVSYLKPDYQGPGFECIRGKSFQVSPYLQQIQLTLIKPSPDLHLEVFDDGQRKVELARSDLEVRVEGYDEPIETLTVDNPPPGFWTLQTMLPEDDPDRCQVNKIEIPAVGQLLRPSQGEQSIQFKEMSVAFKVTDTANKDLPSYPDPRYDLHVEANLVGPSKASLPLPVTRASGGGYQGEVIPVEAGPHQLTLSAMSQNPDGSPYTLVAEAVTTIEVTPVQLVMTLGPGGAVRQYGDVPLAFAVVVTGEQPIELDLPTVVTAVVSFEGVPTPLSLAMAPDGRYQASYRPEVAGEYTLDYAASVDTATGTVLLGRDRVTFVVNPTTLILAKFVAPGREQFIATDPFLRATGLAVEIQLVDENGREVGPGGVGAADPMRVFDIKVLDSKHQDISQEFTIGNTGKPGLFRAESTSVGPGRYEIVVSPATELDMSHGWAAESWTQTYEGHIDRLFWAFLGAALLLFALIVGLVIRAILLRRNPLSGYLEVFHEEPGLEGTYRNSRTYTLTRRNRAAFRLRGNGLIERSIRQLVVTCQNERESQAQVAHVQVVYRDRKAGRVSLTLDPSMAPSSLQYGLQIEKGPRTSTEGPPVTVDF